MRTLLVVDPETLGIDRDAIGLSAGDLAEAAEIKGGASHLRKIERGQVTPGIDVLKRITAAMRQAELRHSATRGEPMVRGRGVQLDRRE